MRNSVPFSNTVRPMFTNIQVQVYRLIEEGLKTRHLNYNPTTCLGDNGDKRILVRSLDVRTCVGRGGGGWGIRTAFKS